MLCRKGSLRLLGLTTQLGERARVVLQVDAVLLLEELDEVVDDDLHRNAKIERVKNNEIPSGARFSSCLECKREKAFTEVLSSTLFGI